MPCPGFSDQKKTNHVTLGLQELIKLTNTCSNLEGPKINLTRLTKNQEPNKLLKRSRSERVKTVSAFSFFSTRSIDPNFRCVILVMLRSFPQSWKLNHKLETLV